MEACIVWGMYISSLVLGGMTLAGLISVASAVGNLADIIEKRTR